MRVLFGIPERMGGETVGREEFVMEQEKMESASVKEDIVEITKVQVRINGQEFYRYFFRGREDFPGFEALCSDVDTGQVNEQKIYEQLGQEWLEREYGKILKETGRVAVSTDKTIN